MEVRGAAREAARAEERERERQREVVTKKGKHNMISTNI